MKRGFGSDNHSGISPEVLEAIVRVNKEHALAYGDDEYCAATEAKFREQFGEQARVFFAFNGTGCNQRVIPILTVLRYRLRRLLPYAFPIPDRNQVSTPVLL